MRLVTASLIGLLAATPLLAQEPATQEPAAQEREHMVRPGDTLSELAAQYFNDPSQWRVIYEANRDVIQDPDVLQPETVLTIPGVPQVGGEARTDPAARADRPARPADDARLLGVPVDDDPAAARAQVRRQAPTGARTQDPAARRAQERENRTVFYRPQPGRAAAQERATVLAEPESRAVPVRPGEFLSAPYLTDAGTLPVHATFLRAVRDDRPGRGAAASAHPQDRVYLSYAPGARPAVDDRLMLVEVGRIVDGAAPLHRAIHPRGIVRVIHLGGEVIEARIEEQYGPVFPGQVVIPIPAVPEFEVEEAEGVAGGFDLEGEILEFVDEQPLYGPTALAFIDLGRRDGVREGDIFEAYLPTRERETRALETSRTFPTEVVAELRVVRVTDATATVRVDDVQLVRLEEGLPVVRTRRIP